MAKMKPYSRHTFNRGFRDWALSRAGIMAVLLGGLMAMLAIATWTVATLVSAPLLRGYLLGSTHALLVASIASLVYVAYLAHNPAALNHVRGAWGEENTTSELQRAKRRRLVWGWVDSVPLERGDIDHLVVTRRGGIVVVDSKWRNQIDDWSRDGMARDAAKARLRAQGLVQTFLKKEHGSHRATGSAWQVTPVIVVWGASQRDLPEGAQAAGIDFVRGRHLVSWLRSLDGDRVDKRAAIQLLERLEAFRRKISRR